MAEQEPLLPEGYTFTPDAVPVYDTRHDEDIQEHQKRVEDRVRHWGLNIYKFTVLPAQTPYALEHEHGIVKLYLDDESHERFRAQTGIIDRALIELLNQKSNAYGAFRSTDTRYGPFDGVAQNWQAYADATTHREFLGSVSHHQFTDAVTTRNNDRLEALLDYAAGCKLLEHHHAHLRALRANYVDQMAGEHPRTMRTGIAKSASLWHEVFEELRAESTTPRMPLARALADFDYNLSSLPTSYAQATLTPPPRIRIDPYEPFPEEHQELGERIKQCGFAYLYS